LKFPFQKFQTVPVSILPIDYIIPIKSILNQDALHVYLWNIITFHNFSQKYNRKYGIVCGFYLLCSQFKKSFKFTHKAWNSRYLAVIKDVYGNNLFRMKFKYGACFDAILRS